MPASFEQFSGRDCGRKNRIQISEAGRRLRDAEAFNTALIRGEQPRESGEE